MEATTNLRVPTPEQPDNFALLCLTNYSGHFVAEETMLPTFSTFVLPTMSRMPLSGSVLLERLRRAADNYGSISLLTVDGVTK